MATHGPTTPPTPPQTRPNVVIIVDPWTMHAEALATAVRRVNGSYTAWTAGDGRTAQALANCSDVVSVYIAHHLADVPPLTLVHSLRVMKPNCRLVLGLATVDAINTRAAIDAGATAVVGPRTARRCSRLPHWPGPDPTAHDRRQRRFASGPPAPRKGRRADTPLSPRTPWFGAPLIQVCCSRLGVLSAFVDPLGRARGNAVVTDGPQQGGFRGTGWTD